MKVTQQDNASIKKWEGRPKLIEITR